MEQNSPLAKQSQYLTSNDNSCTESIVNKDVLLINQEMKLGYNISYTMLLSATIYVYNINNNQLSVTSDYDSILAMLLGSSRNGRLEVTPFSVPTTFGTVSVTQKDALCNTSRLTAPGSLSTCPMCEGWIINVPTILLWYTSLGLDPKGPAILGLKAR